MSSYINQSSVEGGAHRRGSHGITPTWWAWRSSLEKSHVWGQVESQARGNSGKRAGTEASLVGTGSDQGQTDLRWRRERVPHSGGSGSRASALAPHTGVEHLLREQVLAFVSCWTSSPGCRCLQDLFLVKPDGLESAESPAALKGLLSLL